MPRGGKRTPGPGKRMGRPPGPAPALVNAPWRVPPAMVDGYERAGADAGRTASELVREDLERGLKRRAKP